MTYQMDYPEAKLFGNLFVFSIFFFVVVVVVVVVLFPG